MQDFVIIATFTLPTEMVVARGKLESLGIKCVTKDELTVQSYNFISNAVGGVKLLVHNTNAEEALQILIEGGFIKANESKPSKSDLFLGEPKNLRKLKNWVLIFLALAIGISLSFMFYSIITRPSKAERLIGKEWHLNHMVFNGQKYYPNPIEETAKVEGAELRLAVRPEALLEFNQDGTLVIPGFESRKIRSNWLMENEKLTFYNSDTMEYIFNGDFEFKLSERSLIITSPKTSFYCFSY